MPWASGEAEPDGHLRIQKMRAVPMPLTQAETALLATFIDEYMAVEVGPAGRKLRERGIFEVDLLHLLDAYSRTNPARLVEQVVDGRRVEVLLWGCPTPNPPDPPWPDREAALRRNAEVLAERGIP
jgi:hypothetical protein